MGPFARIKRKTRFNKEFALSNDKHNGYKNGYACEQNGNGNLNTHEE